MFYGDGISFPSCPLANHSDSEFLLLGTPCSTKMDAREGFWVGVGHVVSPLTFPELFRLVVACGFIIPYQDKLSLKQLMQPWCLARVVGFTSVCFPWSQRPAGTRTCFFLEPHRVLCWSSPSVLCCVQPGAVGDLILQLSPYNLAKTRHTVGPLEIPTGQFASGFAINVRMFHKTKCFPSEGCNDHSLIWLSESLKKWK